MQLGRLRPVLWPSQTKLHSTQPSLAELQREQIINFIEGSRLVDTNNKCAHVFAHRAGAAGASLPAIHVTGAHPPQRGSLFGHSSR